MLMFERPDGVRDDELMSVKEYFLNKHRIVFINGVIGGSPTEVDSANLIMAMASHSSDPIKIFITSPGGVVDSAMMIYDTMKMVDVPIITVGRYCASAAALLMAAGSERYLWPSAKMMLHLASGHLEGNTAEIAIQKDEIDKTQQSLVDALIECGVNKTPDEILVDINRERWFNAEEAIEYGLADKVVTKEVLKGWL